MAIQTVNGARHYLRLEGDRGRPGLVLVHPIGADCGFWAAQADALARHFFVLRYDLRGHGGSEATPGEYSLDQLSADLLALASANGLERFSVCGVSLGGMVALNAAATAPQRVGAVMVCSSAPRVAPPPGGWDGRRQAALDKGMAPLSGPMVQRMFSPAFLASGDPAAHNLKNVFESMDVGGYAGACAVLRDTDLTPLLGGIKAPTLVMSGEADPLCPPAAARALADSIPGARYEIFDCGHFPPVEKPAEFNAAVLAHLATSGKGRREG